MRVIYKSLLVILLSLVVLTTTSGQFVDESISVSNKWYKSTFVQVSFVPVVLATGSLFIFNPEGGAHTLIHNIPGFESSLDDYLQYAPIPIVYGLDVLGLESRNDFVNQTIILLKAELLMLALVHPLKRIAKVPRPDNSNNLSFPSGHTAQAFVAATFLHHEFKQVSGWISIGGYAMASVTGVYRILQNKHRLSDVLMGASLGILATNIAYLTHKNKWSRKKGKEITFIPIYRQKSIGMYVRLNL